MRKILGILFLILGLVGCANKNVDVAFIHESPKNVISTYIEGVIKKDSDTIKECLDASDGVEQQICNQMIQSSKQRNYTDCLKQNVTKIAKKGDYELFLWTGLIKCGNYQYPVADSFVVSNNDGFYSLAVDGFDTQWFMKEISTNMIQHQDYLEYVRQYQQFVNDENNRQFMEQLNQQTQQAAIDAANQAQQAAQNSLQNTMPY